MVEKIPMTAAGHDLLENELKHRQQVERPRIVQQITDARTHGDLSENAEYHAAKEQQSLNEGAIAELEDKLARADVIDVSKLSGDTIKFGATVTLIDEDTDKKQVWQIVGEPEANAKQGKISITSPLARALINKKKGESVEVVAPRRRPRLRNHQDRVEITRPAPMARIEVPVSAGELVDKLTILEIKSERIADAGKLVNVRRELAGLSAIVDPMLKANAGLAPLKASLRKINETLWEIEDDIRDCERNKDFGPQFVELARNVYRTNDQRAAAKRKIDKLLGSEITEEKSYQAYD